MNTEIEIRSVALRTALCTLICASFLAASSLLTQDVHAQTGSPSGQAASTGDTTTIDPDGTAHIMRVLPLPKTLSPEAQALIASGISWCPGPGTPEAKEMVDKALRLYPVKIEEGKIVAGVKTKFFTPASGIPANKKDRVLIELHGGGLHHGSDSGSYIESIPMANLTQTLVISVDYRRAPPNLFPAAVDDVVAVYKELLKTYKPGNIGIYGTSAGANLMLMAAVRIRHDKLPQPGALGLFSGDGDATNPTDSFAMYAAAGLIGAKIPEPGNQQETFLGTHDPKDPLASPLFADLKGFPPTLCMTGTRDEELVGTSNFNRALLRAGAETELVVFDSMPHAFWYTTGVPESTEALEMQAKWFDQKLGR